MTQPKALRLSDLLYQAINDADEKNDALIVKRKLVFDAQLELGRLHDVNEQLLSALVWIESISDLGKIQKIATDAIEKSQEQFSKEKVNE